MKNYSKQLSALFAATLLGTTIPLEMDASSLEGKISTLALSRPAQRVLAFPDKDFTDESFVAIYDLNIGTVRVSSDVRTGELTAQVTHLKPWADAVSDLDEVSFRAKLAPGFSESISYEAHAPNPGFNPTENHYFYRWQKGSDGREYINVTNHGTPYGLLPASDIIDPFLGGLKIFDKINELGNSERQSTSLEMSIVYNGKPVSTQVKIIEENPHEYKVNFNPAIFLDISEARLILGPDNFPVSFHAKRPFPGPDLSGSLSRITTGDASYTFTKNKAYSKISR